VRFYIIKLTLYLLIGMVLIKLPMAQPLVDEICLWLAKSLASVLGLFDAGIERHGNTVIRYTYGYALIVSKECSGLSFIVSLTAAALACPIPIIKRLKAIVMFVVVWQFINILRLITLVYAQVLLPQDYFDLFHELFWMLLSTTVATGLFVVWARHYTHFFAHALSKPQV